VFLVSGGGCDCVKAKLINGIALELDYACAVSAGECRG